ncbi:MAG: DUF4192 domain-containing protein [Propionibacteriaceae bacterium]|jgi:hypothetical protein|nr:DUF4192 domain-containing protein [Propionibacteriaceae bacterium]
MKTEDSGTNVPLLKLHEPAELVAAVPYLLGFHPADSAVLLCLDDRRLVLMTRVDLADVFAPQAGSLFPDLLWRARTLGADRVLALVYATRLRAERARRPLAAHLGRWLDLLLLVDHAAGRWWEAGAAAGDPGQPIPGTAPDAANPVAAWAEAHGLGPVAESRDDLLAALAPPRGEREDAMMALWAATEAKLADFSPDDLVAAMDRFVGAPDSGWADADYLLAAQLARDPYLRDRLWWQVTPETARPQLRFWEEVVRRVPLPHRVGPLAIVGFLAWQAGEGALMSVCHEECLRLNPDAPVVGLLSTIRQNWNDPAEWTLAQEAYEKLAA